MKEVMKRDGKIEPFDEEKIRRSIRKAAIDAGVTMDEIERPVEIVVDGISNSFKENERKLTIHIRDQVLSDLDELEGSVSAAWRQFDRKYKS